MTPEEFENLVNLNHELLNIEFKGPGSLTDRDFFGLILKAAIRMSNRRDGGLIVIGVDEDKPNHRLIPTGLSQEQVATWANDNLVDQIEKYTEPAVNYSMQDLEFDNKHFIILTIQEFGRVPVICKKDFADSRSNTIVRNGALYAKTFGKPESNDRLSYLELRNLLDLATEKGVQRFVAQARAAGLNLSSEALALDEEKFNNQVKDINNSTVDSIQSRGYWQVTIRPVKFNEKKILEFRKLENIINSSVVTISGYSFPSIILNTPYQKGQDWVGQTVEYDVVLEDWRLYQSGLFITIFAIREDWYDRSFAIKKSDLINYPPNSSLMIERVIYHLTQIFTFASRLSLTDIYKDEDKVYVEITINGLENRELKPGTSLRGVIAPINYRSENLPQYKYDTAIPRADIIANPIKFAEKAAQDIFYRFNLDLSSHLIKLVMNNFR